VPSTRYVLLRAGKGFIPGLIVGVIWALWAVRRRPGGGQAVDGQAPGTRGRGQAALRPAR
jgi:hypothetical protein